MFGKNEIVGQKFFKDAGDKYFVTTIFGPTIQGEGPLSGTVCMFIRLAKCNLACSFCDTYFDSGDWMTIDQIRDKIIERTMTFYGPDAYHNCKQMACIISGGEPSLQHLDPLCVDLHKQFKYVQIESNGILMPSIPNETMLVVSPKCAEKKGKAIKYLERNPNVLDRADALKFVISSDPLSPYHTIPQWAIDWKTEPQNWERYNRPDRQIYISPMNMYLEEPKAARAAIAGKNQLSLDDRSVVNEVISFWDPGLLDMEANQKNHQYAAKYCIENNLKLSLQQHLYAGLA